MLAKKEQIDYLGLHAVVFVSSIEQLRAKLEAGYSQERLPMRLMNKDHARPWIELQCYMGDNPTPVHRLVKICMVFLT